ncbi:MAG: LCP family protein, partial [Bacillota bacterium]|nr:LCP family protein [Bacillota bacterium]
VYNGIFGIGDLIPNAGVLGPANDGLKNRVNVMLIGADQRPEEKKFNTDSLILAMVDPDTRRISLLSIPRDTRISLPGHGYMKINAVAALTDLPTLLESVQKLTGEPIAGYVQTNFQGFKKIIDTLGGITVDVEKDMYYETGDIEDGYINLHKGVQRLDGSKALQYARFRHDALADISRTARQQVVLKAVAKEMFKLSTLPKLPFLIPELMQAVHTNLSAKDILRLTKVAVGFDSSNVVSQTLPGTFFEQDGVSYWKVDSIEVKKVIRNLLQGKTTDKVIDQDKVDLLKPVAPTPSKPLPKVPGNSQDPNGTRSSGYQAIKV